MSFRPLRFQPFKGFYLIYQLLATLFIYVPFWILLAVPRSRRPRPSWDLRRVLYMKLIRRFSHVVAKTGPLSITPNHLAITGGVDVKGVWVEAVPHLVTGVLKACMTATSVTPVRIPGYWMHKQGSTIKVEASPAPGEKVVYHMHGGGYVRHSAHPTDATAAIPRGLLKHVDSVHRTFSIEYRVSSTTPNPVANPFPAALLDALAGYNYLLNVIGFSSSDIIFCGDSAGGNLAHALTRYLVEHKDYANIPPLPSALIFLSPWIDLGVSHDYPGSSSHRFIDSDYIDVVGSRMLYPKDAFLGPLGMGAAAHNIYISPASLHPSMKVNFRGFPKTFITAGGAEVLLDQIRTFKERMLKDLGKENVSYYEAKDGVHDYLVFSWHEPETTDTFRELAKWIREIS
ncbi:endoplasmic reticulum protein [Tricholoma matsutake]|nr:endoplasmic reticulum protein [Tricholoma matsutake 945]